MFLRSKLIPLILLTVLSSCKASNSTSEAKDIIGPAGSVFQVVQLNPFANATKRTIEAALQGTGKQLCAATGSLDGVNGLVAIWFKTNAPCDPRGSVLDSKTITVFRPENIFGLGHRIDGPKYIELDQINQGSWSDFSKEVVYICNGKLSNNCTLDLTGNIPIIIPTVK